MDGLRSSYAALIDAWIHAGRPERARECAAIAVRHGIWKNSAQRPHLQYHPQLTAAPIHDASAFLACRMLEDGAARIREEVARVTASGETNALPPWQMLLSRGRWEQVIFFDRGKRFEETFRTFPETGRILVDIQERVQFPGLVSLLWLYPGSHIVPHCGHTNALLRIHLGLRAAEGATMRVGPRHVTWTEGVCTVFDDSFEHEVWNRGAKPRVILLMDVFHPQLNEFARREYLTSNNLAEEYARTYMEIRGLEKIVLEKNGELRTVLEPGTRNAIISFLMGNGLVAAERTANGIHLEARPHPADSHQHPVETGPATSLDGSEAL
jgi:aspartate beta-hydroxylase